MFSKKRFRVKEVGWISVCFLKMVDIMIELNFLKKSTKTMIKPVYSAFRSESKTNEINKMNVN